MNVLKTLLAGAVLAASAAGANAATYYADKVISSTPGTYEINYPGRKNTANALGAADGEFYSLGLGGSLVVGFAQSLFDASNNISAFEITYERDIGHDEAVDVYSVLGGVETYLGRLLNSVAASSVRAQTAFEYIKLVDVTRTVFPTVNNQSSRDGFDVDAVSIAPVPLPAAGLMLLAGLGGLAAVRRRKTAA